MPKLLVTLLTKFVHDRYPSQKDIAAILELHLRNSLKDVDTITAESWIARMMSSMLDAFRFACSSQESSMPWTLKDIVSWATRLKYYPTPENETDISRHLLNIGHRLFRSGYYFNFHYLYFFNIQII